MRAKDARSALVLYVSLPKLLHTLFLDARDLRQACRTGENSHRLGLAIMNRLAREKRLKKILTALYPIPEPMKSEEEWLRSIHQDLDSMSKSDLNREYERVRWCLLFEDDPTAWLHDRLRVLSELLNERRR